MTGFRPTSRCPPVVQWDRAFAANGRKVHRPTFQPTKCCKLHRSVAWNSQSPVRADHTRAAPRLGSNEKHLLNGHRSQHVIGVEVESAAPERGLKHMTHQLADGVFAGFDQQSGPFEWAQHAR